MNTYNILTIIIFSLLSSLTASANCETKAIFDNNNHYERCLINENGQQKIENLSELECLMHCFEYQEMNSSIGVIRETSKIYPARIGNGGYFSQSSSNCHGYTFYLHGLMPEYCLIGESESLSIEVSNLLEDFFTMIGTHEIIMTSARYNEVAVYAWIKQNIPTGLIENNNIIIAFKDADNSYIHTATVVLDGKWIMLQHRLGIGADIEKTTIPYALTAYKPTIVEIWQRK